MKLELNGTELTQTLDDALIASSLHTLNADDDSFLILSKDTMSYIQTCKTSDGNFVLEYQEGSLDEHYECTDKMLTFQKVSTTFTSYLNGSEEWKTSLTWQPFYFSSKTAGGTARTVKLLVIVVIATLIISTALILTL